MGAPLFYREVNLPFIDAVKDPSKIRWRFGPISSPQPPVVLTSLPVCGNCHSFSPDGRTAGMDVDYANDKGSYVITPVKTEMILATSEIITWSDYRKRGRGADVRPAVAGLAGRPVRGQHGQGPVGVRAHAGPGVLAAVLPDQGDSGVYDRQTKTFRALPGADDPRYVQSNPSWSPDGKYIVFARAKAYDLPEHRNRARSC